MVLMVVPTCKECKTSKNVKFDTAVTKDKTGFLITYCTKCYCVQECGMSYKLLQSNPKESPQ